MENINFTLEQILDINGYTRIESGWRVGKITYEVKPDFIKSVIRGDLGSYIFGKDALKTYNINNSVLFFITPKGQMIAAISSSDLEKKLQELGYTRNYNLPVPYSTTHEEKIKLPDLIVYEKMRQRVDLN